MIDKFYHSVHIEEDLCKGCINCIKRCPTEAIRVHDGKAHINAKFCIDCAECIRICPHHAKQATFNSLEEAKQRKYNIVLVPPSLYGQFNNLDDINIVLNGLLSMGFDEAVEVSAAAEVISEATRNYIEEHPEGVPFISTACPTILRLVRVRFPNLLSHLLPFKSPVELAAGVAVKRAMLKTGLAREDIGVTFIAPCPSKVSYAKAPLGVDKSEIDYCVAMRDAYTLLISHMKAVDIINMPDLVRSGKIGLGWARSGGEATATLRDDYLAADGITNCIRVLEDLEDEKFSDLSFIELDACDGGCVGGVLTVENPYVALAKIKKLYKYMPVSIAHNVSASDKEACLTDSIEYEPVFNLGVNMKESLAKMNQVERLSKKLPGLDCGSCGAPTCKALAEDIVKGEASETDCVYNLRQNLHKISEEVNMLSGEMAGASDIEKLAIMQQYMLRISEEMIELDKGEGEK